MQLTYLDRLQADEIRADSVLHAEVEGPGMSRTYVLTSNTGRDILLFVCGSTGITMMVDECKHDHESDGSVHHHARQEFHD